MSKSVRRYNGKKNGKKVKKNESKIPRILSRKEKRKEQRKIAKQRKHEHFSTRRRTPGVHVRSDVKVLEPELRSDNVVPVEDDVIKKRVQKEQIKTKKLKEEMKKRRGKQLLEANKEEDKIIRKLEKQLKLNKRKSKSVPKSFSLDGLDYLLEVCDKENLRDAVSLEQNVYESYSDIDEDYNMLFSKGKNDKVDKKNNNNSETDDEVSDLSESDSELLPDQAELKTPTKKVSPEEDISSVNSFVGVSGDWSVTDSSVDTMGEMKNKSRKRKQLNSVTEKNKKMKRSEAESSGEEEGDDEGLSGDDCNEEDKEDGLWEDIYGRTRDKDGKIIKAASDKYVPPHMRLKNEDEDGKKRQMLLRLKKQMKGLLNRLSEGNLNSIATQVEQLYMNNSRHDMNKILTELLLESLVTPVRTPERLIMEHVMLIAILHGNVDTEVGVYFLQEVVKRFHKLHNETQEIEDKQLDNIILIISHLYNFKVFNSILMYNILDTLCEKFTEKEIELILSILKSVGFTLRKDNPTALKALILCLQQKAGSSEHLKENVRVKFMLDVLLAIKNNNMAKIPNFDPTHSEHLKKLLKVILHKGSYITEVKLTLEDLLKADERGRWWVVGSAWTGAVPPAENNKTDSSTKKTTNYSSQLLELARKQRMNTDIRREIFCIIMTAEDFLDAFEKLLHLGLKNQQEREMIHVTMDCCLHEKQYNPYYSHLIQKFCDFDRKYQMITQCAVWDKLKQIGDLSQFQVPNLAKLLIHLFLNKGLALSALKVINFTEVDKGTVHLLRQILLGVLLHDSQANMEEIFSRVSLSPKLQLFRESMRIFIKHFVLKNSKSLPESQQTILNQRSEIADKILSTSMSKLR